MSKNARSMMALIDADSILYVIGWHSKDLPFTDEAKAGVESNVDLYVRAMLQRVQATSYLGVFSSHQCFRDYSYLYAPYKGHRPPKPDFMVKWESTMKEYLTKEWGFITIEDLEADDVVSAYQVDDFTRDKKVIVLSPDKDLRQNPGLFYDYKKNIFETVTEPQAMKNFYLAVLTGDHTDNIKGLTGVGPANAAKLIASCESDIEYESVLCDSYQKYYGPYYGPIILKETRDAIQMMSHKHSYWFNYKEELARTAESIRPVPEFKDDFTKVLSEMGW